MLRFVTSFVVDHADHPYFAGCYLIAAVFAVAGGIISLLASNQGLVAGFLVVYAVISAFIGTLGYAITLAGRLIRGYMQDSEPTV